MCGIKIWHDRDLRRCVRGVTWHVRSDVTVWRLSDAADIRKSRQTLTSQHLTSENFWHFCTSISHTLNIMWLKYSGYYKNWGAYLARTVTDLRAPPSSGSDMTRCSQEFLLQAEEGKCNERMSLIRFSNKRMKRVWARLWGSTWYWFKIRFFVKLNLSVSRLTDGQFV